MDRSLPAPVPQSDRNVMLPPLERCNALTVRCGLSLSRDQLDRLLQARSLALRDSGRVEFGGGILKDLILAFYDSPFLTQSNYEENLAGLQELFYYCKNESADSLTDDELITVMKDLFNGKANGSLDYLSSAMERKCRVSRGRACQSPADSTSFPVETARERFRSILFTLGLDEGSPSAAQEIGAPDLRERLQAGTRKIERKLAYSRRLWRRACLHRPQIENRSLSDTLRSIGAFYRRYDWHTFAHLIPCDIDYQLSQCVPDSRLGVDFINEYLSRLCIENDFLGRFDPRRAIPVLERSCPDYRGLLINLYEPVAAAALGLTLLDRDPSGLDLSQDGILRLTALFSSLTEEETLRLLNAAGERLCFLLGISRRGAAAYIRRTAEDLSPRIRSALPTGDLSGVFLPTS